MPSRSPRRAAPRPDPVRMQQAVRDFLRASGAELSDPNLAQTPERVTQAWLTEFLDGYTCRPEDALGQQFPAPKGAGGELVVVTGLHYRSVCPHHLLPYEGTAHLAYVPAKTVVGFGRLSALLDCFAHRLILQEDLAREVAGALTRILGSPATACVLDAEMSCLRLRGERQRQARTHAEAYEGKLRRNGPLRRELWARLGAKG